MEKIIISGFGGQGVLFVGKLLAFTGMVTGKYVSWIPSYGPEMRGGTANCSVIISQKEITSPIVNSCTALLAFNEPSLDKFVPMVEETGTILFDGSLINREKSDSVSASWLPVPTEKLTDQLGSNRLLNMVMVGAYIRESNLLSLEDVYKGMEEMLGTKRPELIDINKKAVDLGYSWKESNVCV